MNQQSQPDILRATMTDTHHRRAAGGEPVDDAGFHRAAGVGDGHRGSHLAVAPVGAAKLGGSRGWATTVMTLVMLLIFVVPFWAAIGAMLDASADGVEVVRAYLKNGLGPPPSGSRVFRLRVNA